MILYWPGYVIFKPLAKYRFHLHATGLENVPKQGPLVIVSNHITRRDPAAIQILMKRPVHYMAKKEAFDPRNSLLEYLMVNLFGAFPVDRGHPGPEAIHRAAAFIQKGECLGIFPETTRWPDEYLHPFAPGAAYFAWKLKVPVLPVGLTEEYHKDYVANFGKPFDLPDLKGRPRDILPQLTELIRSKVKELLPPDWEYSDETVPPWQEAEKA